MIETKVTSLELSKRLKELGIPQISEFYWWTDRYGVGTDNNLNVQDHIPDNPKDGWRYCSAFLAEELGELLPPIIKKDGRTYWLRFFKEWNITQGKEWLIVYITNDLSIVDKALVSSKDSLLEEQL